MSQTAQGAETPGAVTAALTYLVDTGETPISYPSEGGAEVTRNTGRYERRSVRIRDGRRAASPFSLDREGFALVRHATAVSDFDDDAQLAAYEAELEALVKAAAGAARVVVFDHTRRADSQDLRAAKKLREPARIVHNDYTERSAPQRLRDLLPTQAVALLRRRFAIVNVWRPVDGPVRTAPLALCDAQSVAPGDLIAAERRSRDRVGEVQHVTFNPAHRWFYFPELGDDEALLIKTYDSATDGTARFTPHGAFDDPTTPPDAAPRRSIESRCFAFFGGDFA